ncbi:DNA damage-regulated autophagy modulator protein 1-like [Bufo gargarizans]|uniref:DNA damage-regulated autophagy modulator protein 1-like n=1 Tax=Bufo gargarizans TaxID=30331 RepID=UPI001CF3EB05|nr:DNA damage-regulated autophagy modulator protein 1-like [Bufo gargarizans]
MEIRGLAFLPILFVTWTLLGLCAGIAITVILGHSKLPYISAIGEQFPESVVFTVVFMVTSILGAGVASIQYRFMILHSEPSEKRNIICQKILYALGWLACIANAVTGVCSMKISPLAHSISAGTGFFFFAVYNLSQAICLYEKSFSSRRLCHIRLASTLVTIVALLICILLYLTVDVGVGFFRLCNTDHCKEIFSMTGMVGEWMGFVGLTIFPIMYYTDFQRLSLMLSGEGVSIILRQKTQDPENP